MATVSTVRNMATAAGRAPDLHAVDTVSIVDVGGTRSPIVLVVETVTERGSKNGRPEAFELKGRMGPKVANVRALVKTPLVSRDSPHRQRDRTAQKKRKHLRLRRCHRPELLPTWRRSSATRAMWSRSDPYKLGYGPPPREKK